MPKPSSLLLFWLLLAGLAFSTAAETSADYRARLAPLPVDFRSADRITGLGHLQARLQGTTLIIEGSFAGLQGAATAAHLHRGALAIPGPAIADLSVEGGREGRIFGQLELTPEQLAALRDKSLYVQLHSEVAPEGNLRGWLLPNNDSDQD